MLTQCNRVAKETCCFSLLVAAGIVAGCSSRSVDASGGEVRGSAALTVETPQGVVVRSLTYSLTNPAVLTSPRTDIVDLSRSRAIKFVIGGLPTSSGYTITLTADTDLATGVHCVGAAQFGVVAKSVNGVDVLLTCGAGGPDAGTTGSIVASTSATLAGACAAVTALSASPARADVESTMQLSGAGAALGGSRSDVSLSWSVSGTGVGTLSALSGPSTVFTCRVPGTETVTLTASVGAPAACSGATATQSVTLVCDAACTRILTPAPAAATGTGPVSVAVGDLDGDGRSDLVVANSSFGRAGTVSVLLGKGDGTFATQSSYPSGGRVPSSLALGDLNGDGDADVVVTNYNSNTVSVLLGKGNGMLGTPVSYVTGSLPSSVAIGDLDGDGHADLVVADFGEVVGPDVLLGNGDGTFRAGAEYATDLGGANAVAIADLNGDGKPDLVVPTDSTGAVSVLLGKGDGTFPSYVAFGTGAAPWSVAVSDVNRDGKPDLVVANQASGDVSILLGRGDGTFQTQVSYPAGSLPWSVALGDMDGDGKVDVAVANNGSDNVGVLLGNGDGTFKAQVTYGTGAFPSSVAIGRFNADGKSDLVVTNQGSGNASVLLGSCAP